MSVYVIHCPRGTWKQLAVVSDGQIAWFEMVPALLAGWNCRRRWTSAPDDWSGMSEASIVAFKRSSGHPFDLADDSETAWALAAVGVAP